MPKIYCTKCGLRGNSKCPHCRSIFADKPLRKMDDPRRARAQEYLEMFTMVKNIQDPPRQQGEDQRWLVGFWTYEISSQDAMSSVLQTLEEVFAAKPNLEVAACLHDWDIMPGQKSSIGCGHEGPPAGTEIPADPFEKETNDAP